MVFLDSDFFEIGQTSSDLEIDLEATAVSSDLIDIRELDGFKYPSMLVSGVKFNDALRVLQTVYHPSYRNFDVWIDLDDGSPPVLQGSLPADVTTFLTMRYLGLHVTLYLSREVVQSLDLQNPEVLEEFI